MRTDNRRFDGGMNLDSDPSNIEPSDSLRAVNLRPMSQGLNSEGKRHSIKSTLLRQNTLLPFGRNTVVGSISDEENQRIVFFVHNEDANHGVYEFNTASNVFSKLFEWSGFNFSRNLTNIIHSARIVENLCYWTDNFNRPRRLNLTKARLDKTCRFRVYFELRYTYEATNPPFYRKAGTLSSYSVTLNGITVIPPSVFGDKTTALGAYRDSINSNPLFSNLTATVIDDYVLIETDENGFYQTSITNTQPNLAHWIVYENYYATDVNGNYQEEQFTLHRPSPTRPIKVLLYESIDTNTIFKGDRNEAYQFAYRYRFYDGEFSSISPWSVKSFCFYDVMELDFTDDEYLTPTADTGSRMMYLSEIEFLEILIKKDSEGKWLIYESIRPYPGIKIPFINSSQNTGIALADIAKNFDRIPDRCEALEIQSNRVFLGNNLEGFDNINVSRITMEVYWDNIAMPSYGSQSPPQPRNPYLGMALKRGGRKKYGIVYYDKYGKHGSVQTWEGMELYVPFFTERFLEAKPQSNTPPTLHALSSAYTYCAAQARVKIPSTLKPPDWAYSYSFVRTKDLNYDYYSHFHIAGSRDNIFGITNFDVKTRWIRAFNDLNGIENRDEPIYCDFNDNRAIEVRIKIDTAAGGTATWTFQEGDRVRLIIDSVDSSGSLRYIDCKLIEQRGFTICIDWRQYAGKGIDIQGRRIFEESPFPPTLVEIYRPKIYKDDELFYEIGETHLVTNPTLSGRAHHSSDFLILEGDVFRNVPGVYNRLRPTISGLSAEETYLLSNRLDSPRPNFTYNNLDYFGIESPGWFDNQGRPNVIDSKSKRGYKQTTVVFSDKFIQNSNINGFSSFSLLNEQEYPNESGSIKKLIKSNDVMLIIHERTSRSVYIEQEVVTTLNQNNSLTVSDKVMGSQREHTGGYGTLHPESVAVHAIENDKDETSYSKVYWYDATTGVIVRYAQNGLTPISDLGLKAYTKLRSEEIIRGDNFWRMVGGIHPYFNEYMLTFLPSSTDLNSSLPFPYESDFLRETLVFDELKNKFTFFASHAPAHYARVGTKLYAFTGANLYEHDAGTTENVFYGVSYPSEITVPSNGGQDQRYEKKWHNILIYSQGNRFDATEIRNEKGQLSELAGLYNLADINALPQDFERRDGFYFAAFLKDKLTPNAESETEGLLNGDDLYSRWLTVKLVATNITTPIELYQVVIGYILGKGQN